MVFGRWVSHVSEKVFKLIEPSFAHFNAAITVVFAEMSIGMINTTTLFDIYPSRIDSGSAHSVGFTV